MPLTAGCCASIARLIPPVTGMTPPRQKPCAYKRDVTSALVCRAEKHEAETGHECGKFAAVRGNARAAESNPPQIRANTAPSGIAIDGCVLSLGMLTTGEALSVRGRLRMVTLDASDRRPLMEVNGLATIVLLRDASGAIVPYRIDEAFSLSDQDAHAIGDYTVLVNMNDADADPVIVRALDADIPSFVGIEDEGELLRVRAEYNAIVMRRGFRVV